MIAARGRNRIRSVRVGGETQDQRSRIKGDLGRSVEITLILHP
jgi:hypothetical protein